LKLSEEDFFHFCPIIFPCDDLSRSWLDSNTI